VPPTNIQVEKTGPRERIGSSTTKKGPYLLVRAAGHKWWRFKYRYGGRADGKPGQGGEESLTRRLPRSFLEACARETRRSGDCSPTTSIPALSGSKKNTRDESRNSGTFEAVAREWLTKQSWGESHGARNTRRLEQHVFPCVGSLGVSSIKRAQIKEVLHRIEKIGHIETAFAQHANTVVILLCGGDKRTQAKDIEQAHAYWKDYKAQNRT
jgi:hypothetical protein